MLQDCYVYWFSKRGSGPAAQRTAYEDTIKKISEFSTVEGFWCTYCHLLKASALPNYTDYHLFKKSIRPLWEVRLIASFVIEALRENCFVSSTLWGCVQIALPDESLARRHKLCHFSIGTGSLP